MSIRVSQQQLRDLAAQSVREIRMGEEMAATKKTTTKRTGGKTTKARTAGKTVRAAEAFKVPRTAKQLAAAIQQRQKRSPGYWGELQQAMAGEWNGRVTQVMPRSNPPEPAHH